MAPPPAPSAAEQPGPSRLVSALPVTKSFSRKSTRDEARRVCLHHLPYLIQLCFKPTKPPAC